MQSDVLERNIGQFWLFFLSYFPVNLKRSGKIFTDLSIELPSTNNFLQNHRIIVQDEME
jgi:hypothetical protein